MDSVIEGVSLLEVVSLMDGWMDGWMKGVLGHFYALSRLNWAGNNLGK